MMRGRPPGILTALFLLSATGLGAQMAPGARAVGMGGAGMVFATGVDAVEWNPANLGWAGGWNLSLLEVGAVGLGSGVTVGDFVSLLEGGQEASAVVAGLPADGIRLALVAEGFATAYGLDQISELSMGSATPPLGVGDPLPSIGVAFGSFAVRVRSRVYENFQLSRQVADLIGNGFSQSNLLNYAVGNTGWGSLSTTEFTVSYGTTVGSVLSLGVGGRYVQGHGMVQGRFFEPVVDIGCFEGDPACDALSLQTVAVEAQGGTGYGLDVGLSLDLPGGLRAGASGTNVIQRMTWPEDELTAYTATFTEDDFLDEGDPGFTDLGFEDYIGRFQGQPLDPNSVSLAVYQASQGLFEGSYYPQTFRAGVGWQAGGTSIEAVGIKVSPRGRFVSDWDERVALGIEQKLPVLTLRAGLGRSDNGITQLAGGFGLGIGPVNLEASGGRFSGERVDGAPWEGYYLTTAIQLRGGGR